MRISLPSFALAAALAFGSAVTPAPGAAQPVDPSDLLRMNSVSPRSISPDGRRIAYGLNRWVAAEGRRRFETRIASVDGSEVQVWESGRGGPVWSPDGTRVAYTAQGEAGERQIWTMPVDGGAARQVTHVEQGVGAIVWAPDGRAIAFTMRDPADPSQQERIERQEIVRVASDDPPPPWRLWLQPLDEGSEARPLTDASFTVASPPAWSPDGRSIAFLHRPEQGSLETVLETWLSVVDVASGSVTALRQVGFSGGTPVFSPDGRWIAVTGDVERSRSFPPGALYAVRADGSEERFLSEADDFMELVGWAADGSGVLVTELVGTTRHVRVHRLDGAPPDELYAGPLQVSNLRVSADGTMAVFVAESLDSPPELYTSPLDRFDPEPITDINADFSVPPFGRTEVLRWTSADGATIEGMLTYPADYDGSERVPLLVVAHAGTEAFTQGYVGDIYNRSHRIWPAPVFTSRGYAVLRVNNRGGGLQGSGYDASTPAFRPKERSNPDILAGVDRTIEMGLADPDRLAIMGWSNGGLVTMSLLTETDRFAAAITFAGIPELITMAGIHPWMAPEMGAEPWENLAPYLEHAPILSLDRVSTPVLILQGDNDGSVPTVQAEALYGSLQRLGVPTSLAIYPGMNHLPNRPEQMIDMAERSLAWFDRYLKGR